ncbi:MAG: SpoIIE family protein phosphatase [Anaerolineae bacterium]|jgi:serine phosphatase RsbU (regulator of sigma subunit)
MNDEKIQVLRSLPFLRGMEPLVLERLADALTERHFQPGQIILQEGSEGGDVHLIVEGRVEVVKGEAGDETLLAERGPGDLFGEMGLLEKSPRFATIRALEPTRLLQLPEENARALLAEQPLLLYRTVQVLSARLREADLQMIADLQRKNRELARAYRDLQAAQAAIVEKERLERELELARDLQQSILPNEFPQPAGFSFAARSRPARQVGGDFYDVIPLSEGHLGLVMADVSDKGMPAALFMALTRSLLRAEAKRQDSPRQVLLNVNRLLLEMSRAEMFVTVFYGVLDPAQRSLRYARAGHDHPLLFRAGSDQCRALAAYGMPLGFMAEVDLEEADAELGPGDRLILYSDGITHAESSAGEFFGLDRLRQTVCSAGPLAAQELCDLIFERVSRFQVGAVQFDDMALLLLSVGG